MVTTVLWPEVRDKRLRMHEIKAKEIKWSNVPSNRDVDLTYATSSSVAAGASSEHERANIDHRKETSSWNPHATNFADRVQ